MVYYGSPSSTRQQGLVLLMSTKPLTAIVSVLPHSPNFLLKCGDVRKKVHISESRSVTVRGKVLIRVGGSRRRTKGSIKGYGRGSRSRSGIGKMGRVGSSSSRSTGSTRDSSKLTKKGRRRTGRSTGMNIIKPVNNTGTLLNFFPPHHPMGTSNSNDHEGSLNSTCRFSYQIGADRTEGIVDAARARMVRFM